MSDLGEYDFEPVPGLPEELPDGERMLWQGAPNWRKVALHVLHVRKLAVYFALLLIARQVWLASAGTRLVTDLAGTTGLIFSALLAIGLLTLLAWLIGKTTLYTLTNKRVVLRIGVALPMTLNLPFTRLSAADVRLRRDGSGDIIMQLAEGERLSYMVLWPHVKTRSVLRAQPALRSLSDPETVARLFSDAVAASEQRRIPAGALDADPAMVA